MISKNQYGDALLLIAQYKKEQLELKKLKSLDFVETSIPLEQWKVHKTHCCFEHGCKYGNEDCPVVLNLIKQDYKCEDCD